MHVTRREFLLHSGQACLGYALGAAAFAAGVARFSLINAFAQGSDYRALVCVFLAGGNDGNNMVVPLEHHRIQRLRRASATRRAWPSRATRSCRSRRPSIGSPFGLHPSLARAADAVERPASSRWSATWVRSCSRFTRADYQGGAPRPYQLFSHSDQIAQWQSAIADRVAPTGWGGPHRRPLRHAPVGFPTITALSGGLFTRGQTTTPLSIASAPTALNQVLVLNGFGTDGRRSRTQAARWSSCARSTTTGAGRGREPDGAAGADIGQTLNSDVDAHDGVPQHDAGQPAAAGRQGHQVQRHLAGARTESPDLLLPARRLRYASESGRRRSRTC